MLISSRSLLYHFRLAPLRHCVLSNLGVNDPPELLPPRPNPPQNGPGPKGVPPPLTGRCNLLIRRGRSSWYPHFGQCKTVMANPPVSYVARSITRSVTVSRALHLGHRLPLIAKRLISNTGSPRKRANRPNGTGEGECRSPRNRRGFDIQRHSASLATPASSARIQSFFRTHRSEKRDHSSRDSPAAHR